MKKVKSILSVLLSLCLTIPFMAGCNGSKTKNAVNSGGNVPVVRVVVPGLSEKSTTDPISGITSLGLQDFENYLNKKVTGAHIKLSSIPWDGWIQKIEAMATAGEMDVGFFTNQVAVPDWYMDLTPYLEKDPTVNMKTLSNIFIEPAVYYTKYKSYNYPEATNKIFGLPMTMACNVCVYDKKLFSDWGMKVPDENATMDDLVNMAVKMTGKNPVTGKQNYGAFIGATWLEWYAISYDAVKSIKSDDMKISGLNKSEYVDYIKNSPEVLNYFNAIQKLVSSSPEGIATNTGNENFFTPDNNIAINFDTNTVTGPMMKYVVANKKDVTDRFAPILIPTGKNGKQGFPEFFRFSVCKKASNPDAAWDVVKQLTTNKDIVNFYLTNYAVDKISALKDTSGMKIMENSVNKKRHDYQMKTVFLTDDYWTWRTPLQDVNKLMISKTLTPEAARAKFYDGVNTWVENTKAQLGQK